MTQEEKQILLADLCARLPYGVKYRTYLGDIFTLKDITLSKTTSQYYIDDNAFSLSQIKLYLRPMSSMTMEEECEFCRLFECDSVNAMYGYINWVVGDSRDYDDFDIEFSKLAKIIDWLNEHHFDYRGLIEMGLALEVPEGIYNI